MSRFSRSVEKLAREHDVRGLLEISAKGRGQRDGVTVEAAVRGLGSDAVAPLTDLLADPTVRQKAALGLVAVGDVGGLSAVLQLAERNDEESQHKALYGLYAFARYEGTVEAFQQLHRLVGESEFATVRQKGAAMSMTLDHVVMERIQGVQTLIDRLADASTSPIDPRQLFRAAVVFEGITGPPVIRLAVRMLLENAQKVTGVSLALAMIGEPAVRPTIEAIRNGKRGMAWPLAYLGCKHPEARDGLAEAAQSNPDPSVRAEAARVLEVENAGRGLPHNEHEMEQLAVLGATRADIG